MGPGDLDFFSDFFYTAVFYLVFQRIFNTGDVFYFLFAAKFWYFQYWRCVLSCFCSEFLIPVMCFICFCSKILILVMCLIYFCNIFLILVTCFICSCSIYFILVMCLILSLLILTLHFKIILNTLNIAGLDSGHIFLSMLITVYYHTEISLFYCFAYTSKYQIKVPIGIKVLVR